MFWRRAEKNRKHLPKTAQTPDQWEAQVILRKKYFSTTPEQPEAQVAQEEIQEVAPEEVSEVEDVEEIEEDNVEEVLDQDEKE